MINWNDPDYQAAGGHFAAVFESVSVTCATPSNKSLPSNARSYVYSCVHAPGNQWSPLMCLFVQGVGRSRGSGRIYQQRNYHDQRRAFPRSVLSHCVMVSCCYNSWYCYGDGRICVIVHFVLSRTMRMDSRLIHWCSWLTFQ